VTYNFSSENATLIPRLQEYMEALLKGATTLYAVTEPVLDSMDYQNSMLARVVTCRDALQEAVLIDMRDAIRNLYLTKAEMIDLLVVAHNDIVNGGEVHFPFDSMLLRIGDDTVLHVYKLDPYLYEMVDKDRAVYNFTSFLTQSSMRHSEPLSPMVQELAAEIATTMAENYEWQLSDGHFQVLSDKPQSVQFDSAFHLSSEGEKDTLSGQSSANLCFAYLFLFLTQHEKMKAESVGVPLRRNSKRTKRGQHPYCEYREVKLGDFTKSTTPPTSGIQGSHSSPKMHIRSGHWHRFSKPTKAGLTKRWYKAKVIGDPSNGVIIKWYKMTEDLDVDKLTRSGKKPDKGVAVSDGNSDRIEAPATRETENPVQGET